MSSVDLIASSLDSIRQISEKVADAVVYIDSGCAEAFQMIGALPLLLEIGARAVCSLENMSPLDTMVCWTSVTAGPAKKLVIITLRLLSDAHRYILRCLSTHQNVQSCSIYTSVSEVSHSACVDSPLGQDAFHEYEALLLLDYDELVRKNGTKRESSYILDPVGKTKGLEVEGWSPRKHLTNSEGIALKEELDGGSIVPMESANWSKPTISVDHLPMVMCPLSPRVFVLPSESTIAEACLSNKHEDALSPGLPAISTGLPSDGDDVPAGATLTAHFLYHLASKLDMKMEIFSIGDLSKSIGKIMTDMSSLYDVGRRSKRTAGLLLIDRTLDLVTPCCHGDTLIDRIFSSLPRRNRVTSLHSSPSQLGSKHGNAKVERTPLDVWIPLEIPGKIELAGDETLLSEQLAAFSSGWKTDDLVKPTQSTAEGETKIRSGSLISSENYRGVNYFEALLDRKTKDGSSLIKKWLMDIVRNDKISLSRSQMSLASANLQALNKFFISQEKLLLKHKGIIQLAAAAAIALGEPHSSHWDALASAEKMLAIGAGDTSQSLSSQIRDLINTSNLMSENPHGSRRPNDGLLSFQDTLLLAVIGYILAGENFPTSGYNSPFSWEEEHSLKEAVVDAILEMQTPPKYQFLDGLEKELEADSRRMQSGTAEKLGKEALTLDEFDDQWGAWDDEDPDLNDEQTYGNMQLKLELRDRIDNLFKTFHKLSGMKWRNHTGKDGLSGSQKNFGFDNYQKKGVLHRLLTMILEKSDIPGLEYHSSAMGRFLKSGLGRFGLRQSKPTLGDQNTLLIFVVGGINCHEVFEAREAVSGSNRPDLELIVGGTTLLTPEDMFELLLGSSSYI